VRPATAGVSPTRKNLQEREADTKLGRPSTASEGAQRGQSEGGAELEEGRKESSWDSAGGGSISPRKIPRLRPATAGGVTGEQRGDVPLMPTYTVAGKRMPLIQLLREKIWQVSDSRESRYVVWMQGNMSTLRLFYCPVVWWVAGPRMRSSMEKFVKGQLDCFSDMALSSCGQS
jgi:hypothetical protein